MSNTQAGDGNNAGIGPEGQRQQQYSLLCQEIERLCTILPDHDVLGMTAAAEHKRFCTALNKSRGFTLAQLQTLDTISDRCVASTIKIVRQAEKHGINTWIQEILDPKKGLLQSPYMGKGHTKSPHTPHRNVEGW